MQQTLMKRLYLPSVIALVALNLGFAGTLVAQEGDDDPTTDHDCTWCMGTSPGMECYECCGEIEGHCGGETCGIKPGSCP